MVGLLIWGRTTIYETIDSETLCVCAWRHCSPVGLACVVPERGPKCAAIESAVKTLDCLLEQASGVIARWPTGARTWTQTLTLPPDWRVVKIYLLQNPWISWVEFFLGPSKRPKLRTVLSQFQPHPPDCSFAAWGSLCSSDLVLQWHPRCIFMSLSCRPNFLFRSRRIYRLKRSWIGTVTEKMLRQGHN